MKRLIRSAGLLLALLLLFSLLAACSPGRALQAASDIAELLEEERAADEAPEAPLPAVRPAAETPVPEQGAEETALDEDGIYTSKEDLALYIHLYGHLPSNFITKDEARKAGWDGGSLDEDKLFGGLTGTVQARYDELPKVAQRALMKTHSA